MHIDKESVKEILKNIKNRWQPEYILIKELYKKEGEELERYYPRILHNYKEILSDKYQLVKEEDSLAYRPHWYSILLFKRA